MTRLLLALALLLTTLPADAQPYASVGEALHAKGCDRACVCRVATCQQPHDCRTFNPAVPFDPSGGDSTWLRYGFPSRPANISDGTHSAGLTEAKAAILSAANPLSLALPYPWTQADEWDVAKVWCGSRTARAMVRSLVGGETNPPPAGPCPGTWNCGELDPSIRAGCVNRSLHCTEARGLPPSNPECWRIAGSVLGKQWVLYAGRCDPWGEPVEPEPPDEPDEPVDPEEPEEPPVEVGACGDALDALIAAAAEVERECRP